MNKSGNISSAYLFVAALVLLPAMSFAAGLVESNSWSLVSPDGQCEISVSLGDDGSLSYQALRGGKVVIQKSPIGLQRDHQDFERGLVFHKCRESPHSS